MGALFRFVGFPPPGPHHLVVAASGSLVEAACLLREALELDPRPRALPQALLQCCGGGIPLDRGPSSGAVDHRYRIRLRPSSRRPHRLECWRLYGGGIGWQRRCGPLDLEEFLAHLLPADFGAHDGSLLRDADMGAVGSQASVPLHNLWPPSRPVFSAEDCYVRHRFPYRQRPR